MDIDPSSFLEVSLQEGPGYVDSRGPHSASNVVRDVGNAQSSGFRPSARSPQDVVLNNALKLSTTSKEEEKFRRRAYCSLSLVLRKRLHCTICDSHIGAHVGLKGMDIEHPLLQVLACTKCTLRYHYLEYTLSPEGRDVRCRWCTSSGTGESPLRYCSGCPFAFCEMCIYRNLPLDELAANKDSWVCFVCNVKDLWPSRAVLWALKVLINTNIALKEERKWSIDQSSCCRNKAVKQQRRQLALPLTNGQNLISKVDRVRTSSASGPPASLRTVAPFRPQPGPGSRTASPFRQQAGPVSRTAAPFRQQAGPVSRTAAHFRQQAGPVSRTAAPIRPQAGPVSRTVSTGTLNANKTTLQLYDTTWLTDKVGNISTTILNLNNNLLRLSQGISDKENKFNIKSKMISMVSLLNISATQLQKASKEMEDESRKILDRNYRVAQISSDSSDNNRKRNRPNSTAVSIMQFNNETNFESNTDWNMKRRKLDEESSSVEEDVTCYTEIKTKPCFVKLERLDDDAVSRLTNDEPQPSTSADTVFKTESCASNESSELLLDQWATEVVVPNGGVQSVGDTPAADIERASLAAVVPAAAIDDTLASTVEDTLSAGVSGAPVAADTQATTVEGTPTLAVDTIAAIVEGALPARAEGAPGAYLDGTLAVEGAPTISVENSPTAAIDENTLATTIADTPVADYPV